MLQSSIVEVLEILQAMETITPLITEAAKRNYLDTLKLQCTTDCGDLSENLLPNRWMDECMRLKRTSEIAFGWPIRFYSSDGMMFLYKRERKGRMTEEDHRHVSMIDNAIMNGPRPEKSFVVFRGLHNSSQAIPGQIVVHTTPKSGTFDTEVVLESYATDVLHPDTYGYAAEIEVPEGTPCFYNQSESQVIFPSGARFEVIEGEHVVVWWAEGRLCNVLCSRWRYIGV